MLNWVVTHIIKSHILQFFLVKGQLISNILLVGKLLPKNQQNYFWISALKFFCSFLGAFWKLFRLPADIVSDIIHKESYRKSPKASRKPQGSYKKFQGRNPEIITLDFWKKFSDQKDILNLTDLYRSFFLRSSNLLRHLTQ